MQSGARSKGVGIGRTVEINASFGLLDHHNLILTDVVYTTEGIFGKNAWKVGGLGCPVSRYSCLERVFSEFLKIPV